MPTNEKFLVTGGMGLLGSRLIPLLSRKKPDSQMIVVSRTEGKKLRQNISNVQMVCGDLREAGLWSGLPKNITHVFHLAAVIPKNIDDLNRSSIAADNLLPLAHLIEQSRKWSNLKQVIYSSSISVYPQIEQFLNEDSVKKPANIYAASKLAGEQLLLCLEYRGVKVASLRYSSLYAYGQHPGTVLPIMMDRAIQKKEILVYGDGTRVMDFLHCDDAAYANLLAYKKQKGGVFNIGSGVALTMTELARTINEVFTNDTAEVIHLRDKVENGPGFKMDISKARQELGYVPMIKLKRGLQMLKKSMGGQNRSY
jgi:nucleoside-diphosphate-sugar epimerase